MGTESLLLLCLLLVPNDSAEKVPLVNFKNSRGLPDSLPVTAAVGELGASACTKAGKLAATSATFAELGYTVDELEQGINIFQGGHAVFVGVGGRITGLSACANTTYNELLEYHYPLDTNLEFAGVFDPNAVVPCRRMHMPLFLFRKGTPLLHFETPFGPIFFPKGLPLDAIREGLVQTALEPTPFNCFAYRNSPLQFAVDDRMAVLKVTQPKFALIYTTKNQLHYLMLKGLERYEDIGHFYRIKDLVFDAAPSEKLPARALFVHFPDTLPEIIAARQPGEALFSVSGINGAVKVSSQESGLSVAVKDIRDVLGKILTEWHCSLKEEGMQATDYKYTEAICSADGEELEGHVVVSNTHKFVSASNRFALKLSCTEKEYDGLVISCSYCDRSIAKQVLHRVTKSFGKFEVKIRLVDENALFSSLLTKWPFGTKEFVVEMEPRYISHEDELTCVPLQQRQQPLALNKVDVKQSVLFFPVFGVAIILGLVCVFLYSQKLAFEGSST